MSELSAELSARLMAKRQRAAMRLWGMTAACSTSWRGVRLGRGCRFYGRTLFRRAPGSRLEVGDQCEFRSAHWSNPAGVSRPCMLNTAGADSRLVIGAHCGLSGTVLTAVESVEFGDRVLCGTNVTIIDSDFHALSRRSSDAAVETAPIYKGDDVWLGVNVIVLKGVTIGEGSVIAAGSVVVDSLPLHVLAGGYPAKVLRTP
jgi:acetyltransferase-like isoleucine patch superfamily enzyme